MHDNNKYSILLVEDNPDHLSFEQRTIEKLDRVGRVHSARTAKEANKAITDDDFDLIVLDYDLPDTNGLTFLDSLMKENPDVPVVMVTGLGNEKIAVQAMKLGAYDYIVKDRDYLKSLPDVIRNSIEKLRLSRSLKQTQLQLKESEERYQQLYENANSGFVSIDLVSGKYIKPNKKILSMTGFSERDLLDMHVYELASPEERDRVLGWWNNGGNGTPSFPHEFEVWITTKDKGRIFVNCTVATFPEIKEVFMTITDITDRKILEDRLQHAHEQLKQHTKELENKVDELKKKLIIEPALEALTDTEQKYNLDMGCSYLVKEERPQKSYEIFKDLVSHGIFGLVITRTIPTRIQKIHNLEKTPMVWLSKRKTEESSISGSNLGGILYAITEFVEKSPKSVIILDGLEFLITVNGFDRCIQFMNDLFEIIMMNSSVLLIPINEEAVEKKELAILERSTEDTDIVTESLV